MHYCGLIERRRARPILKQGFSLIEIVIVLGIVSFALVPLVAGLALAYQKNKSSKETTELAWVMQSCNSLLRSASATTLKSKLLSAPMTYYFADGGRYLGTNTTNAAFYRCVISLNTNAPQNGQRIGLLAKIEYPAPAYPQSFSYPIGIFNYGPKLP